MTSSLTSSSIGSSYIPPSGTAGVNLPDSYTTVDGMVTSQWTIADSLRINEDREGLSAYQISTQLSYISDTYVVTDYGHLRSIHGENVTFNSWYVMWAVCSPKISTVPTSKEILNAEQSSDLYYFYSQDGMSWILGGKLLSSKASVYAQCGRCSLVMREGTQNTVDLFYNSYDYASNTNNGSNGSVAMACSSGTISVSEGVVSFTGFSSSSIMMIPDGILYNNLQENDNLIWADPYPFVNPGDGSVYCLFTSNKAGMFGYYDVSDSIQGNIPYGYNISQDVPNNSSVIGIAKYNGTYDDGDFSTQNWSLLEPLISGLAITKNMSRPSVLFNGRYTYILFNNDRNDFVNGLNAPSGLYGFYSTNGIFGPYEPLNGCGQVLTNPSSGQTQSYSYYCDSNGLTYSSVFSATIGNNIVYGGTPSPTNSLTFYRNATYLTQIYNFALSIIKIDWATIYSSYQGNSAPWIR